MNIPHFLALAKYHGIVIIQRMPLLLPNGNIIFQRKTNQSDSQSVGAILKRRQKYIISYILFLSLVYRPQNIARLFLPNGARNLGLSKPDFGYRYYPTVSKMTPIGVIQRPFFRYNFRGRRPRKKIKPPNETRRSVLSPPLVAVILHKLVFFAIKRFET